MPRDTEKDKFETLTIGLVVVNVIVFLLSMFYFDPAKIFELYSFSNEVFTGGNYLRIITSSFLHLDFSHLFWNMLFLFLFGRVVEKKMGRTHLILIYFFSMVVGNLFFAILFPDAIAVGASGAVFGLMGTAILIEPFKPIFKFVPVPLALIGTLYLFGEVTNALNLKDGVAHIAHVGGMLGGFAIAFLAEKEKSKRGILAVILFLLLAAAVGFL